MTHGIITFIGGGNMATSLIGGLINDGYHASQIRATDPLPTRRQQLSEQFGITTFEDNSEACAQAQVVVLAVKPQVMSVVVKPIGPTLAQTQPLVLSIAAGIREPDISRWLGYDASVVRTMPNTPALVSSGVTGMFANARVSDSERSAADAIMKAVGRTVWVQTEAEIDAVTAVSGSGPAYFFLLMELMAKTGEKLGLEPNAAQELALQTALGAARIAIEGEDSPATLRQKVTSPGGTTERALQIFQVGGMPQLVEDALTGARDRAQELADELGQD